jgi:TatD DNase family protein
MNMELIDAHAHMNAEAFEDDLPAVLAAAESAGVRAILAVSETVADARLNLELADRHPIIRPCAGLHPTVVDLDAAEAMVALIRAHRDRLTAIGEVGLDYWIVQEPERQTIQRVIFGRFIGLSNELDLPLNVHSRSAGRHVIAFLREHGAMQVLLHAFDGKASAAMVGVELGYYFSIPPSIVRSPQKQKLVRHLPLERLLLESDAPVLGPDPAARNEPKNVRLACDAIAQIKALSAKEVARITTENARRLFPRAFS